MIWIDDMLCSRLLHEHQGNYLALAKRVRAEGASRPRYFYVSVYRPLWAGRGNDFGQHVYVHSTERTSFIGSLTPLGLDVIRRLELVPFDQRTKAQLAIEYAAELGRPVELTSSYEDAALLFRNPRHKWQLSFFEAGVGPTGHTESEDPVEILSEAIGRFCHWAPGIVDAIIGGLEE